MIDVLEKFQDLYSGFHVDVDRCSNIVCATFKCNADADLKRAGQPYIADAMSFTKLRVASMWPRGFAKIQPREPRL